MIHNKFRYILTLVALLAMTAGAWADETLLLTIESKDYFTFKSGSMTFDDKVTVNFSNSVYNDGDTDGWYSEGTASLLTVTGINGYTITSCKFYTNNGPAKTGYTVEGESPSVYLYGGKVYIDDSKSVSIGTYGVTKIEVYTAAASSASAVEVDWTAATKTGTFTMPAGNVELQVEYYPGMLTLGSGAIEGGKLEVVGLGLGTTSFTAPSEWSKNSTILTSGHFEGFKSVTEEEAKAWPGVPATGLVALYYNYDETEQKWDMIYFKDGAFYDIYKGYKQQLSSIYNLSKSNFSVFYTTGMQMPAGFEQDEDGNIYVAKDTKFTVKATPAAGYYLQSWADDDKVTDLEREITMGDDDLTLTPTFAQMPVLTLAQSDATMGTVTIEDAAPAAPANIFPVEGEDGKYYVIPGSQITLKATAAEGYNVAGWKVGTETIATGDGIAYADYQDADKKLMPATSTYTFTMTDAKTIAPVFGENEYNVEFAEGTNTSEWTATPNPAKTKQTVTVTYTGTKKVIGVKAEKKAAAGPPEYYDKLTVTVRTQGQWSCASGPQATFIGQTITEEQAIALAKYQASKSGNNTVVFYKKESWQMYYAKSDGTTSYGDVATSMGLDGYDVYYVAQ